MSPAACFQLFKQQHSTAIQTLLIYVDCSASGRKETQKLLQKHYKTFLAAFV